MARTGKGRQVQGASLERDSKTVTTAHNLMSGNLAGKRPIPLYQQVKEYINEQLSSGSWPTGTKTPSENELIRLLGVSKMTVNRALRELTTEGVLQRVQGVGTFVAEPKATATLLEIKPIEEEIQGKGGTHSFNIHDLRREKASPDLALAMSLPPGAEVFHVIIVHYAEGVPVQLEDRYVNPAMAPHFMEQDYSSITPSRYLLNEVALNEIEHVVEAVLPDKSTQELLDIDKHEPCIVLYRRTWASKQVVTRCRFIHPGSRYRFGGRFQPAASHKTSEA